MKLTFSVIYKPDCGSKGGICPLKKVNSVHDTGAYVLPPGLHDGHSYFCNLIDVAAQAQSTKGIAHELGIPLS